MPAFLLIDPVNFMLLGAGDFLLLAGSTPGPASAAGAAPVAPAPGPGGASMGDV